MNRKLRYIAQPFVRGKPGRSYPFMCAVDAEAGGEILARSADGVVVFQQWVDADAEIYCDPEVLAIHGDVPRAAVSIDPDGAEPWLDDVA